MPEKLSPARIRAVTLRGLCAAAALALAPLSAEAAVADANMALCRNAAIAAADRHGIPREVLLAITQVETRTKRDGQSGPWPWTVNVAGKGAWFDNRAAALLHAQQALASGERSFDVGCFQLNYRWHGEHFASIDQMFEPGPSGDYAARFLKELHAETGDWITASGHYHSRTPVHADRYRNHITAAIRRMGGEVPATVRVAAAPAAAPPGPAVIRVGGGAPALTQTVRVRAPRDTDRLAGTAGLVLRVAVR